MLLRISRLLFSTAAALLFCFLLLGVLPTRAAVLPTRSGGLPEASMALSAGPTPFPAFDTLEATAYVTPSVTTVRAGEMFTVQAELVLTGSCQYPIYSVSLLQSDPLLAYIDPRSEVIGPPGPNPAAWKLQAVQTGVTTLTASFYGEVNCGGGWQWTYVNSQVVAVTVISSSVNLPLVGKLLSYLPPPPAPPPPVAVDLGTLGGTYGMAYDVNNYGWAAGSSRLDDEPQGVSHAFLWHDGKMEDMGTLGGADSVALHINDRGQVAGESEFGPGDEVRAFFWENGRMTDMGALGGSGSQVVDLNLHGQVIGTSTTAAGDRHCFLWAEGVMTDLGTLGGRTCRAADINDKGQIAGSSTVAGRDDALSHAFLWENGVMTDFTPGDEDYSTAVAINERGQVIGFAAGADGSFVPRAVLWENGLVFDLSYNGDGFDFLQDINDRGQIVGYGNFKNIPSPNPYNYTWDALLWDNGVLLNLGVKRGRWPNRPTLLNNRGQIIVDAPEGSALWHNGILIPFEQARSAARAISDSGLVAGGYYHAQLWRIEAP
jgi:probable HAF family extracellular repeat protein